MKAIRALRYLRPLSYNPQKAVILNRLYSAESQQLDEEPPLPPAFDSKDYILPNVETTPIKPKPVWDQSYRDKADRMIFSEVKQKNKKKVVEKEEEEEEEEEGDGREERRRMLERVLLEAALEKPDHLKEKEMVVKEEDQMSLSVGIIGAPNAGKSSLTNFMVGTKVAAVSRKTNTTTHEVLGVMTKGNTQICFFDTPGLMLRNNGFPGKIDAWERAESAWSSVNLYDVLIVIFDVYRHLNSRDKRVARLIAHLGAEEHPKQKRVLCMNKVDLVEDKKDLLTVAKEFGALPGYQRYFMISGLKGSGVKDLTQFLMDQAVKRPWDEDPTIMTEDYMKNISLEVVREKMLHYIHQEIPYVLDHRLIHWKELRDGSIRIEQHFITKKQSQRKILVGKNGSKIGRIGMDANEELRAIFKRDVHLILQVRVST